MGSTLPGTTNLAIRPATNPMMIVRMTPMTPTSSAARSAFNKRHHALVVPGGRKAPYKQAAGGIGSRVDCDGTEMLSVS